MFQGKTTIVVGAGGSEEVGLPLGGALTANIAGILRFKQNEWGDVSIGDAAIETALRRFARDEGLGNNINPYLQACRAITAGMREAQSIDEFMHTRNDDLRISLCGKLGIVHSILHAEKRSGLFYKQQNISDTINFEQVQQTWFAQFKKFVFGDCSVNDVAERFKQITLVVFNYDRCLEHYLMHSLENYYTIDQKDAVEILGSLEIIHPYGVVGPLPWQDIRNNVGYGHTDIHNILPVLTTGIRTFTEQAEDSDLQDKIRLAMQEANLILFLGFAYHQQNLDLLTPGDKSKCTAKVIGTAKGISDSDIQVVRHSIAGRFSNGQEKAVELRNDLKCYDLFDQYRHRFGII